MLKISVKLKYDSDEPILVRLHMDKYAGGRRVEQKMTTGTEFTMGWKFRRPKTRASAYYFIVWGFDSTPPQRKRFQRRVKVPIHKDPPYNVETLIDECVEIRIVEMEKFHHCKEMRNVATHSNFDLRRHKDVIRGNSTRVFNDIIERFSYNLPQIPASIYYSVDDFYRGIYSGPERQRPPSTILSTLWDFHATRPFDKRVWIRISEFIRMRRYLTDGTYALNHATDWLAVIMWIPTRVHTYRDDIATRDYRTSFTTKYGDCEDLTICACQCHDMFLGCDFSGDADMTKLQEAANRYVFGMALAETGAEKFGVSFGRGAEKQHHILALAIHKRKFGIRVDESSKNQQQQQQQQGDDASQPAVFIGEATSIVQSSYFDGESYSVNRSFSPMRQIGSLDTKFYVRFYQFYSAYLLGRKHVIGFNICQKDPGSRRFVYGVDKTSLLEGKFRLSPQPRITKSFVELAKFEERFKFPSGLPHFTSIAKPKPIDERWIGKGSVSSSAPLITVTTPTTSNREESQFMPRSGIDPYSTQETDTDTVVSYPDTTVYMKGNELASKDTSENGVPHVEGADAKHADGLFPPLERKVRPSRQYANDPVFKLVGMLPRNKRLLAFGWYPEDGFKTRRFQSLLIKWKSSNVVMVFKQRAFYEQLVTYFVVIYSM